MNKRAHVLIAGGGIGGLTAALALLRLGFDVDVYEQAAELKEIGAGVSISPNGARALFALGLEKPVRELAVQTIDKEIRIWNSGERFSLFDHKKASPGALATFRMHRGDLHTMLARACQSIKEDVIHLNHPCAGFEETQHGVELRFASGASAKGDVLIGADGLRSRIRNQLLGNDNARFSRQIAWRGLFPMDRFPPEQRRLVGATWIGPTAHVTCYPVRSGELFNFVGQVDRDAWEVESWNEEGSKEECLEDFKGWHEQVQFMIQNLDKLYKWGLFIRDPLPRWTYGPVTLLGDACHSTLPYLGQGANMGLEDGFILARCLDKFSSDATVALQRYEMARRERTTAIVTASNVMVDTFHDPLLATPEGCKQYVAKKWNSDQVDARYDWIFNYDPTTVPI